MVPAIRAELPHLHAVAPMQDSIATAAALLATAVAKRLLTKLEAEAIARRHLDNPEAGVLDEVMHRAVDQVVAHLARFGFAPTTKPAHRDAQVIFDVDRHRGVEVLVGSAYVINIGSLSDWAGPATRRIVMKAAARLQSEYLAGCDAGDLYEMVWRTDEAAYIAREQSKLRKVDYDAAWQKALDCCEHEEGEDGAPWLSALHVGREGFDRWLRDAAANYRRWDRFTKAPARGKVDHARCRRVINWAARVHKLCDASQQLMPNVYDWLDESEGRNFREQTILTIAAADVYTIDEYFRHTDDGSGEPPMLQCSLNPKTGMGLIEPLLIAMIGSAAFDQLEDLTR